jgi:hypothetical protein
MSDNSNAIVAALCECTSRHKTPRVFKLGRKIFDLCRMCERMANSVAVHRMQMRAAVLKLDAKPMRLLLSQHSILAKVSFHE